MTLVFIVFFVTLIEIPAMILLGVWAVLQFLRPSDSWGPTCRASRSRTSPTWAGSCSAWPRSSCSARDGMMNTGRR